jgi:iron complex transport system substrate-binding protein
MRRALLTLTIAGSLALAACGGDDDAAATTQAPTTTAATTTTATATTASTAAAAGGYVAGADPDADAAAVAWTTAFDSSLTYDAKAAAIADAEALKATIDAYTQAGLAVGGITLVPTAVAVTGDTAAITYDVEFAGQPAYQGQEGTLAKVAGTWQVSREEFCGFMAAARNPCPAG